MPTNFTNQEVVMSELFFACRVVNVRNSLPDTVGFTSRDVFKRCIRTVDFSEFLMCKVGEGIKARVVIRPSPHCVTYFQLSGKERQ